MARHLRKTRRAKKQKRSQHSRKQQQHGGGFTYDGVTGYSTGGVPIDARTAYDHCYADPRAAMMPNVGSPKMFGGGCGEGMCGLPQVGGANATPTLKVGGGSGSGGYGFVLNNDLGKVYADAVRAPCPSVSGPSVSGPSTVTSSQQGGDRSPLDLVSYPAGYDMARPYSTNSAHFLEPVRYDRMCAGGSRKHRTRKHKHQSKKSRKH